MARIAALCLSLLVVGCAAPAEPTDPVPGPGAHRCLVSYPDGSPFDCESSTLVTKGIQPTAPTLQQGWRCLTRYDDGAPGTLASYIHQDGRLGVYWDLKEVRPGLPNFVEAHVFYTNGAMSLVIPYQPRGFVVFPEKPREAAAEMHLVEKSFRLEVMEAGTWYEPSNATLLHGSFEGEAWYVYRFETSSGTQFLNMVGTNHDDESRRKYTAGKQFYEGPEYSAYADVATYGAKYRSQQFAFVAAPAYQCVEG